MDFDDLKKEIGLGEASSEKSVGVDVGKPVSIKAFLKFVSEFNIKDVVEVDTEVLKKKFKGLKDIKALARSYPFYDNVRLAYDREGKCYLVLQPYLTATECIDTIEKMGITSQIIVRGKANSWFDFGKTTCIMLLQD